MIGKKNPAFEELDPEKSLKKRKINFKKISDINI